MRINQIHAPGLRPALTGPSRNFAVEAANRARRGCQGKHRQPEGVTGSWALRRHIDMEVAVKGLFKVVCRQFYGWSLHAYPAHRTGAYADKVKPAHGTYGVLLYGTSP